MAEPVKKDIPIFAGHEKRHFPAAALMACLLVLAASVMPWGVIRHDFTEEELLLVGDMVGPLNYIHAPSNPDMVKPGSRVYITGPAWKSGFREFGITVPHWILAPLSAFILLILIINYSEICAITPTVPRALSVYGLIHVLMSAWGFLSQGAVSWGLGLTGVGFFILIVSSASFKEWF